MPPYFSFVFEHRFAKIGGEVNKMFRKSNLQQLIQQLKTDERFSDRIGHWHTIEEKQADTVDFPEGLDPRIRHALEVRGSATSTRTSDRHSITHRQVKVSRQ